MHIPADENYAVLKPEWVEWDSELPYNKGRTATFFGDSISIYQVWARVCVCMCACACVCVRLCVYVCVCAPGPGLPPVLWLPLHRGVN